MGSHFAYKYGSSFNSGQEKSSYLLACLVCLGPNLISNQWSDQVSWVEKEYEEQLQTSRDGYSFSSHQMRCSCIQNFNEDNVTMDISKIDG